LPGYYGVYAVLWCVVPAVLGAAAFLAAAPAALDRLVIAGLPPRLAGQPAAQVELLLNDIKNVARGSPPAPGTDPAILEAARRYRSLRATSRAALAALALFLASGGALVARRRIKPDFPAIERVERFVRSVLFGASLLAVLTTLGIVLSLLFESLRFFARVPATEFLFGLEWSPQTALRADQVAASGKFGAVPLFAGTFLISGIAMAVAAPVGLLSALYLSEYAGRRRRALLKPTLELLAGVPTVVYGFFAALTVAPWVRRAGEAAGLDVASESALAAGLVMGVMIIPFVSSLADDVIRAVPRGLREASLGLGATQAETIRKVVFPAALPGIVAGLLLGLSRAIGETMIVVMAAGLAANLTLNPLEAVTTVTVQIVTLLVGDQEFDSPKTLAAFALGLTLFAVTLLFNVIALRVVRRYREVYE
ncbi:MAG: phosphate ABC transporter permease subunit PstC, partial [Acidobacteria bacterium]